LQIVEVLAYMAYSDVQDSCIVRVLDPALWSSRPPDTSLELEVDVYPSERSFKEDDDVEQHERHHEQHTEQATE